MEFDVVTNVEQIGLLGNDVVTVTNVVGDVLYFADSDELLAATAQGSLTAGSSATFTATVYVRSAGRSTVQAAWSDVSILTATTVDGGPTAAASGAATVLDGGASA